MQQNGIHFTKMHGLGNDFVVINTLTQPLNLHDLPVLTLADRHIGVGFDQLLLIEPSTQADFFCRILNADGSEALQCGNGLRCVARFVHEKKLHLKSNLTIETRAGIFPIHIKNYDNIQVTLAAPTIDHALVPFPTTNGSHLISLISTGNPHAILKVDNIDNIDIDVESAAITTHFSFPNGVNIGFMEVVHSGKARLRTLERGVGETLACGSNACAASVAGIVNGWLKPPVHIAFRLGHLIIEWKGEGKPVHLTGPAATIFSGYFPVGCLKSTAP